MRTLVSVLALLLVALAVAPSIAAHGDVRGLDETIPLSTGEAYDIVRPVHYHRLVGTVEATDVAMPLLVNVTGPGGTSRTIAGPDDSIRVNHLIDCCEDDVWTDHTITVWNAGSQEAFVRIDLTLLHDDFAVIAADAEDGAAWQTLASIVLIAGIPAWVARRRAAPEPQAVGRWLRVGTWSLAAGWGVLVLMSVVGMLRYGGGPLVGSLVVLAPLAVPGEFFNSHLFASVALMASWAVALAGWAIAQRRSPGAPSRQVEYLAYVAAAGPVVFGVLFTLEYGNVFLAAALGLIPAGLILAAVHWPRRVNRTRPPTA